MNDAEKVARKMLAEVYRPGGIEIWLQARNRALGGERAIDLLYNGQASRVFAAIEAMITGAFT